MASKIWQILLCVAPYLGAGDGAGITASLPVTSNEISRADMEHSIISNPHVADKDGMSVLNLATSTLQHDSSLDTGTLAKAARRRRRSKRKSSRRRRRRSKRKSSRRRRRRSKRKSSRRRRRRTKTPARPRPRPRPPAASTNSFVPIGEDDCGCTNNTFDQFEWLRNSSSPPKSGPECHCQDICYLFGDPHIVTFDGDTRHFMQKGFFYNLGLWPKGLNHFWAVHSESIHIEGLAALDVSWMRGVAVAGPFLSGHRLEALNNGKGDISVSWDGGPILTNPGDVFSAHGVTLKRTNRASYLPTDDQLKKFMGKINHRWFSMDTVLKSWKDGTDVYIFEFPEALEIFMTSSALQAKGHAQIAVEVVIRMPPQPSQGGWCGNFNGNKGDDSKAPYLQPVGQSQEPPSLTPPPPGGGIPGMGGPRPPGVPPWLRLIDTAPMSEDWKAMLDASSAEGNETLEIEETVFSNCDRNQLRVARAACDHLPEKDLRDACVMDACSSEEPILAERAADDVVVISSVESGKSRQKCQCRNPW